MKLKPFRRKLRWGFVRYDMKLAAQGLSLRVYTKFPGGVMWFFNVIWGGAKLWIGWA